MKHQTTEKLQQDLYQHTVKGLFVHAFSKQHEVANFLKAKCHQSELGRFNEIMQQWEKAQPYLQQLMDNEQNIADTVQTEKIPAKYAKQLQSYTDDFLFKKTFSTHQTELALIETDNLVVAQRSVDMEHCARLMNEMRGLTGLKNLFKFCIAPNNKQEPVQHIESGMNNHIFTSPNSDVRFLGSSVIPLTESELEYAGGGFPVAAVISFIGYGAAPVNVFKTSTRYVLHNGFHRVYALKALGINKIPVVIQNATNELSEFPSTLKGLPREYLLKSPRPTLMKDFFDPALTMQCRVKKLIKSVQMQISPAMLDIPY